MVLVSLQSWRHTAGGNLEKMTPQRAVLRVSLEHIDLILFGQRLVLRR